MHSAFPCAALQELAAAVEVTGSTAAAAGSAARRTTQRRELWQLARIRACCSSGSSCLRRMWMPCCRRMRLCSERGLAGTADCCDRSFPSCAVEEPADEITKGAEIVWHRLTEPKKTKRGYRERRGKLQTAEESAEDWRTGAVCTRRGQRATFAIHCHCHCDCLAQLPGAPVPRCPRQLASAPGTVLP